MPDYAPWTFIVAGEGVPAVTCLRCGATLTLHRDHDAVALHDAWHARTDAPADGALTEAEATMRR